MEINIYTHNSIGLINDANILVEYFKKQNIRNKINIIKYKEVDISNYIDDKDSDINIFLEHIIPSLVKKRCQTLFVPNIEMLFMKDIQLICKNNIKVLSKTDDCYKKMRRMCQAKNIGWTSIDRDLSNIIPNYNEFLHLKGNSKYKNSQIVLDTWIDHPEWPMLHIAHYGIEGKNGFLSIKKPVKIKHNIILYQYYMDDTEVCELMNKCGIHICPSSTEGFGHYINEARSTGALIIAPNHPPMNELCTSKNGIHINVNEIKQIRLSSQCFITKYNLENAISICLNMEINERMDYGNESKNLYRKNQIRFDKCNMTEN